jgi:hypothetical protein
MNCCLPKTIKKEDVKCDGLNLIHEYNYSCYECLEKIKGTRRSSLTPYYQGKGKEKPQVCPVYQGLKEVGILELIPPEDKKVDEELDRIEKLWDIYLKSISVAKQN